MRLFARQMAEPADAKAQPALGAEVARAVLEGTMSMGELRHRYILHVHVLAGSYVEAGRRVQIDWRTVR